MDYSVSLPVRALVVIVTWRVQCTNRTNARGCGRKGMSKIYLLGAYSSAKARNTRDRLWM